MEVKCPKCKKRYEIEDAAPGQEVQCMCPRCANQFNYVVPQPIAAVVPAAPVAVTPATTETELIQTHPCRSCGCPVNDGATYCPVCGSYQLAGPDPKAQPVVQPQVVYVQQPQVNYVQQPQPQVNYGSVRLHNRDKTTAGLLALFLGGIGVHKFYLGQTGLGILYLIFCWTWIPGIIALVEAIVFFCTSDTEFDAKYNYR